MKGLWMDSNPEAQPEGTYRMAINAVKEPNEAALSTEPANKLVSDLPGALVGTIPLDGEQAVLFCEPGYIMLYDQQTNKLTQLIDIPSLDFNRKWPIQGKHKVVNGCERSLYWCDGYHEDRFYNLDAGQFSKADDFRLVPFASYPVYETEVLPGGELKKGTYLFVLELLASNQDVLLKTVPSQPVQVREDGQQINLSISGVTTPFIRVNALHYTSNNGVTVSAYTYEELIQVSGDTVEWSYNGRGLVEIDFKSLLSTGVWYDVSRYMEVVHGRLLRGNLSEKAYDYSSFQKSASKVKTNYVVQESEADLFTEQGDEVKAYGVVYLMKNGSLSPVFHIPGRAIKQTDTLLVKNPVPASGQEVFIDYAIIAAYSKKLKGWVIRAIVNSTEVINNIVLTVVANPLTYTKPLSQGVLLGGQNNDYIVVPDASKTLAPGSFVTSIEFYKGGVKYASTLTLTDTFDDVSEDRVETVVRKAISPEATENIVRWKIEDTSVKDTKELGYWASDEVYVDPVNYCGTDYWGVDADGVALKDSKIRYHKIPSRETEPLYVGSKKRYIGIQFSNLTYPSPDVVGHFYVSASANTVLASGYLLPFNDKQQTGFPANHRGRYIHWLPNSDDKFNKPYNSLQQNFISPYALVDKKAVRPSYFKVNGEVSVNHSQVRSLEKDFFEDGKSLQHYGKVQQAGEFTAGKEFLECTESVFVPYRTSSYKGFSNRSLNQGMNLVEVDTLPTTFNSNSANLKYVHAKKYGSVFQSLSSIRYRFMQQSPVKGDVALYSGDTMISSVNIFNVSFIELSGTKQVNCEFELIENLFMETPYDFSTIDNDYYFDGRAVPSPGLVYLSWAQPEAIKKFLHKLIAQENYEGGTVKRLLLESVQEVRYDVNKDIGVTSNQKVAYHLPISFNYCSDCLGHYPNRLIFSEVNSQEQQSDAWRSYAPLNYQDIAAHRGQITAFDYTGGVLVVRCNRGVFLLQPDPQRIEMSGANLYLGNPQFLGVPAQEMATDASGYGGQQGRLASVVTPSGLFWYDEGAGKVFGYAGQVTELSRNGMYNFFASKSGSTAGAYVQLSYDPYLERVLIHRREIVGEQVESFTVSYSLVSKSWLSFHAYNPLYMFYLNRSFYTSVDKGLWLHNDMYNFCTFYGKTYSFQVGLVYSGGGQTRQWHSVQYYAPVKRYVDGKWEDVLDKTFNKAFANTRKQCSGLVTLKLSDGVQDSISWNTLVKTVVQADRNYRISGLRDINNGGGILSSSWTDRAVYYNGEQGFQDVVPVNIDYTKPEHEQLMFRDKFIEVRLWFETVKEKMLLYITDYTNLPQTR